MTVVQDPTVQRRRLRAELRRARDAAGMTQAEVARAMDWSSSKLIRIERGDVGVSTNDVRALLNHYGVKDKDRVDTLLGLARSARAGSVYNRYAELLEPGFKKYLAYEASASAILQYEHVVIPDLLQTEEYGRAMLQTTGRGTDDLDTLWTVRQRRQDALCRENPAKMSFILDEAALRRFIGHRHVVSHQLERLRDLAAEPHISIQIIPFDRGAHPFMAGSFVLLESADSNLDDMVYLGSVNQNTILDDYVSTARYRDTFTRLEEMALAPADSVDFLAQIGTIE
jgi:transcriptional regulator with XRE-family HTH domain